MSESDAGRQLDEALGIKPMAPKPEVAPDKPKPFPERALRDKPGEAPLIENDR